MAVEPEEVCARQGLQVIPGLNIGVRHVYWVQEVLLSGKPKAPYRPGIIERSLCFVVIRKISRNGDVVIE